MAITRCPYCRAIVDEKDQYCSNCGTQILYADDAEVEEEIPGEKILNADPEEKDYTIPEPGESVGGSAEKDDDEEEEKDGAEDEEPEEAEEKSEEESEDVIVLEESEAPDKPPTEELASVLKAGEREPEAKPEPEAPKPPARRARRRGPDVIQPAFNFGEAPAPKQDTKTGPIEPDPVEEAPALPEPEAVMKTPVPSEAEGGIVDPVADEGPAEDVAAQERSPMAVTFDTRELESIGPTVDLGRHQIEQFLEVLREKEAAVAAVRAPGGLPPWANGLKETPVPESEPESEPEVEPDVEPERGFEGEPLEEEEAEGEPDTATGTPLFRTDSGVGLPERISQAKLPFAREETPDEAAERGEREPGEEEEEEPRPPFRLSVFLKAKAFDILFIVAVWLVTLWLAARALERTIFELFASASTPLLLFGAALLVLYIFLFRFFLGETLGDRLFRDSDEDTEV